MEFQCPLFMKGNAMVTTNEALEYKSVHPISKLMAIAKNRKKTPLPPPRSNKCVKNKGQRLLYVKQVPSPGWEASLLQAVAREAVEVDVVPIET
jgi:hypothetical protein